MNENQPTVIRASSLSGYPDCNRRGAARLFRQEIEATGFTLRRPPRGIGAAIGTAVHAAARVTFEDRMHRGRLPSEAFAADVAAVALTDELASDRGEVTFDLATANRSQAFAQVVMMARAYHRVIAPQVEPIIVEERLEAEIIPGLILSGAPDTVAREPGRVRDLKSGSRASPGSHAPQIGAYALLARTHGLEIDEAAVDYVQRVAPTKPQPDPVSKPVAVAIAETAATNILRHIDGDLRTFRLGDPERRILPGDPWSFQANPSSILCSEKYCPAFGTDFCREGDPAKAAT
jgi:hypothetical protein